MRQISNEELKKVDAYWRASNYLSVAQIYLKSNALMTRPLTKGDIKPRLLGHFGTTPGLNFIYAHLNRQITTRKLKMMLVVGPGHGAPGILANTYLEGSYSELYPEIQQNKEGLEKFLRQFSWPYGIPSHCAANVPGSINEGGELGYSLVHAFGAAFDNPDLVVPCIVGDGEAESGTLAASWHSNKFLNPISDGTVLPILHLNGFKIANPTVLSRVPQQELLSLFDGYGYQPYVVEGHEPSEMHSLMAKTLDAIFDRLHDIREHALAQGDTSRPKWPMLILRSPKGWTGPHSVDGKQVEGTWRSHQIPLEDVGDDEGHLALLEEWLRSYRPQELFDQQGALRAELAQTAPQGTFRMGMNAHSNGGILLQPLVLPDFRKYAVAPGRAGGKKAGSTETLGVFLRDVMLQNAEQRNFRVFGPDETASNRLQHLYEATPKRWQAEFSGVDENLSTEGRVLEVLSENLCQGWLEGYLLTGRHGLFACYEAFIQIIDSMFNQHAKWLRACRDLGWRRPIASLNYLLSSHVWQQDHNGFSHQDPGFIDHIANKQADIVRLYLPPDANTLLVVSDHCLRSRNYVNVIIAGKQESPVYLDIDAAVKHCKEGLGIWHWAGNVAEKESPDVILACAGDVPTLETLAAVMVLREWAPELKVRVVNIVDLFTMQKPREHPHGLEDDAFESIFTADKPIILAFHGYPSVVHKVTYNRRNHANIHVSGFRGEGTTTTPFDMTVLNNLDRYSLALNAIKYALPARLPMSLEVHRETLQRHRLYVSEHGQDMPEIRNWQWCPPEGIVTASRCDAG